MNITHNAGKSRTAKQKSGALLSTGAFVALLFLFFTLFLFSPNLSVARAEHDHSSLTPLADSFPTASGAYYLTQDIEISSPVYLSGADISIDCNGFRIIFTGSGRLAVGSSEDAASLSLCDCTLSEGAILLSSAITYDDPVCAISVGAKGALTVRDLSISVQRSMFCAATAEGESVWENVRVQTEASVALSSALVTRNADARLLDFSVSGVGVYAIIASGADRVISLGGSIAAQRGVRLGAGVKLSLQEELIDPIKVYAEDTDSLAGGETRTITAAKTAEERARNDLAKLLCDVEGGSFVLLDSGEDVGQIAFEKDFCVSVYNGDLLLTKKSKKRGEPLLFSSFALEATDSIRQIGWRVAGESEDLPVAYLYTADADLSVSVVWERYRYSITYKGDFSINKNPDSYSVDVGVTLVDPVRPGYTFVGWSEEDGAPEIGLTIPAGRRENVTVTAVWEIESYSISYVGAEDGERGVSNKNPANFTVESGEIAIRNPTRYGYDFVRWDNYMVGEEPVIAAGSVDDRVFTAIWRATVYTISYLGAEDGENGVTNRNPSSYTVESAAIAIKAPYRRGFLFSHWTQGGEVWESAEIPAGSTGNITLQAHWTLRATIAQYFSYRGVYDANAHEVGVLIYHELSEDMTARYEWRDESGKKVADFSDSVFSVRNVADSRVLRLFCELSYEDPTGTAYECADYVCEVNGEEFLYAIVEPAPLSITPSEGQCKIYGEKDKPFSFAVGFGIGDENPVLQGELAREAGESAGRYAITQGSLSLASDPVSSNYAIDFAPMSFEIKKKKLTVRANATERVYGDLPTKGAGVRFDGFLEGENESVLGGSLGYSSDYPAWGAVGAYEITPLGLTAENYEIVFAPGTLTVLPLPITIKLEKGGGVAAGKILPASAYAVGALNGDVVSIRILYGERGSEAQIEPPTEVGVYSVCASLDEKNYAADPVSDWFVVKTAALPCDEHSDLRAEISGAEGFDPTAVLSVRKIENKDAEAYLKAEAALAKGESVALVLDVRLLVAEESVALTAPATIRLALPASLAKKKIVLLKLGESAEPLAFSREGNEILFEIDSLTPVAFVIREDARDPIWLVILLAVLLASELGFGVWLFAAWRKRNSRAALLLLPAAISSSVLVSVIVLSSLVLILGAAEVFMAIRLKKKRGIDPPKKEE